MVSSRSRMMVGAGRPSHRVAAMNGVRAHASATAGASTPPGGGTHSTSPRHTAAAAAAARGGVTAAAAAAAAGARQAAIARRTASASSVCDTMVNGWHTRALESVATTARCALQCQRCDLCVVFIWYFNKCIGGPVLSHPVGECVGRAVSAGGVSAIQHQGPTTHTHSLTHTHTSGGSPATAPCRRRASQHCRAATLLTWRGAPLAQARRLREPTAQEPQRQGQRQWQWWVQTGKLQVR